MNKTLLDLRKVFGLTVMYTDDQQLVSPEKPFIVLTELYPGGKSAVHLHPNQEETYEVKEGEMEVLLDGKWNPLKAGETITIPKGKVHAFRNKSSGKVIAVNIHNPGLRFGEMLNTIHHHILEGKLSGTSGLKNLFYIANIMVNYNDVMVTINPPNALIRVMARAGKLLGYC